MFIQLYRALQQVRTVLGIGALFVLGAGLSQAAVVACNTGTIGVDLPAQAIGNGCSSVDLNFVNLSTSFTQRYWATAGVPTTGPVPDTITTTTLHINGCNATGGGGAAVACTDNTNNVFADTTNNGAAVTGTSAFLVQGNNGSNAPDAGYHWAFTSIAIGTPNLFSLTGTDTVSAAVTLCFQANSATVGSGGCLAANLATFTVAWDAATGSTTVSGTSFGSALTGASVTGGVVGTVQGVTLNLPTASQIFYSVFTSTAFNLNTNGTSGVSIIDFSYGFNQTAITPEPSTYGMLGSALLGLGFLVRKRRRS